MAEQQTEAMTELPKYVCHKEVRAARIIDVRLDAAPESVLTLLLPDDSRVRVVVDREYMQKHKPQLGGYFVQYDDGYRSFSPCQPFEAGYTLVQS